MTDKMAQLVTPAYAIETGTFTLAPWQTITAEGIKLNTPPGKELEDPNIYNGNGRIFGPDGQNLVPHPAKDFQGLLYVDVSYLAILPLTRACLISDPTDRSRRGPSDKGSGRLCKSNPEINGMHCLGLIRA